jgi:hypothetical protein
MRIATNPPWDINCEVTDDSYFGSLMNYTSSLNVSLLPDSGDRKVCVRFSNATNSAKCGGVIFMNSGTTQITLTPTPTIRVPSLISTATPTSTRTPTIPAEPTSTGSPQVTVTQAPAGTMYLNYKLSYGGVNVNSAQCVIDWPLQFIVLGGGTSKVYENVIPPTKTIVGERIVFSGTLALVDFNKSTGVSVFIKGPKHLQMKYGINNQISTYNKAGGELTLTSSVATSPIYDFSDFPLMPGDVVGTNGEAQDGWINGVDFSYIKSKSLVHETIDNGGFLKGELDGNCQVNSNDVNLLKISLQDKQGQLY